MWTSTLVDQVLVFGECGVRGPQMSAIESLWDGIAGVVRNLAGGRVWTVGGGRSMVTVRAHRVSTASPACSISAQDNFGIAFPLSLSRW